MESTDSSRPAPPLSSGGRSISKPKPRYKMEWYPLDGVGFVPNLFHHLWKTPPTGRSIDHVYVPDTVIFRENKAAFWYFTSKKTGQIMRKASKHLSVNRILATFRTAADSKRTRAAHAEPGWRESEVRACVMVWGLDRGTLGDIAVLCDTHIFKDGITALTTFRYLDYAGLKHFLMHEEKADGTVLQKWMPPDGTYNTVYRVDWLPGRLHVEQRQNLHLLNDKTVSLHQRVLTYEGAEHNSIARTSSVHGPDAH